MTNIVETQQEKYARILATVCRALDIDDYSTGVTTGEEDDHLWIKVKVRTLKP